MKKEEDNKLDHVIVNLVSGRMSSRYAIIRINDAKFIPERQRKT
jgi:hypothetical protein